MYDRDDLLRIIKEASCNAVEANKPVNILFGLVISNSPLKIQVEQKLILEKEQLVLSRNVTDFNTTMTININTDTKNVSYNFNHTHSIDVASSTSEGHSHQVNGSTENQEISLTHSHNHTINGTYNVKINNSLKNGDKVILLRVQKGQKYIVLDRIGG